MSAISCRRVCTGDSETFCTHLYDRLRQGTDKEYDYEHYQILRHIENPTLHKVGDKSQTIELYDQGVEENSTYLFGNEMREVILAVQQEMTVCRTFGTNTIPNTQLHDRSKG
ncbi:CBK_G0011310.mRNA.1.CDS.1 [Saccharomyces cerevisiae]|nr:CBK_G0011310.mRNA.1.CDS.1 [Saccharomyces cerevisiae]CAI7214101.1 CBK_G0011310.mRNA.1.CDS.1 [Saccharomyces cerevisiae]